MQILIKFPTRGRPDAFLSRLREWTAAATRPDKIAFLVSYDEDDATMTPEVLEQAASIHPNMVLAKGVSKTKIEACNSDLNTYLIPWDVVLLLSDDMFCRRQGWDEIIRENMTKHFPDTDGSLWFYDSAQKDINTLTCFGRAYYLRFNYLYHPSYASFFCLHPDTRVYMANQTIKPISEVIPGDVVVGSERRMPNTTRTKVGNVKLEYLCESLVTEVRSRIAEMILIKTEGGREIKCTADHLWGHYPAGRYKYCPRIEKRDARGSTYNYSPAFVGMKLVSPINFPPPPPLNYERELGWFAGIWDGEGSFPRITQSFGHNEAICAEIERLFDKFEIPYTLQTVDPSKYGLSNKLLHHYYIKGGRDFYLKFLDWVRPFKNNTKQVKKRMFAGRFGSPDVITSIEPIGAGKVYCLTTSTKNYVAEGVLSHNCDNEQTDVGLRDGKLAFIEHAICSHEHPNWCGGMKRDATYIRNNRYWQQDRATYARRKAEGFPL